MQPKPMEETLNPLFLPIVRFASCARDSLLSEGEVDIGIGIFLQV